MKNKKIARRQFIKDVSVGIAGAGLMLSSLEVPGALGSTNPTPVSKEAAAMEYRPLGKTGMKVSAVSFGVMNTDSPDLIRKALDLGIKHLDTAHGYMRGNSETVIGQVLEERKARDKVYLATKMYFDRDKDRKVFQPDGGTPPAPAGGVDKEALTWLRWRGSFGT